MQLRSNKRTYEETSRSSRNKLPKKKQARKKQARKKQARKKQAVKKGDCDNDGRSTPAEISRLAAVEKRDRIIHKYDDRLRQLQNTCGTCAETNWTYKIGNAERGYAKWPQREQWRWIKMKDSGNLAIMSVSLGHPLDDYCVQEQDLYTLTERQRNIGFRCEILMETEVSNFEEAIQDHWLTQVVCDVSDLIPRLGLDFRNFFNQQLGDEGNLFFMEFNWNCSMPYEYRNNKGHYWVLLYPPTVDYLFNEICLSGSNSKPVPQSEKVLLLVGRLLTQQEFRGLDQISYWKDRTKYAMKLIEEWKTRGTHHVNSIQRLSGPTTRSQTSKLPNQAVHKNDKVATNEAEIEIDGVKMNSQRLLYVPIIPFEFNGSKSDKNMKWESPDQVKRDKLALKLALHAAERNWSTLWSLDCRLSPSLKDCDSCLEQQFTKGKRSVVIRSKSISTLPLESSKNDLLMYFVEDGQMTSTIATKHNLFSRRKCQNSI